MKRIQTCKKVNRNNTLSNHINRIPSHINTVTPEILVGQIWLQEDEPTAVEIIELNSSDEYDPSPDEGQNNNLDHAWSYIDNDKLQKIEDNYKINRKARERWRKTRENHINSTNTATNTNNDLINQLYSDIAGKHMDDSELINHQVNCFTIINKHFVNSDTSSEGEFADVEMITSNDMEPNNWDQRNNSYDEEIITDLDKETRTIWIYSFKNKHLLTENDYELTNIGGRELSSSSSCSLESDEELTQDKSTSVRRIGSPIPPAYIPRLNLSLAPTLSTVTEVSEPVMKQASSNGSNKSSRFKKSKNGWFLNDSEKLDSGRSIRKREKTTNIVNWMALSPREKRRRSKDEVDRWEGTVLKLESPKFMDALANGKQHADSPQDKAFRLQVDVDVHVSVNEKSPDKRSTGTPTSADVNMNSKEDKLSPKKIKCLDTLLECVKDRGDHEIKFENNQQVLCHTVPPFLAHHEHLLNTAHVHALHNAPMMHHANPRMSVNHYDNHEDDPVKISSEQWKLETEQEKQTANYDYETGKMELAFESGTDSLWMKNNMPLLKPSEWNEYVPIAESLSLQMSIASIPEEHKPWYKRIIKYICCK